MEKNSTNEQRTGCNIIPGRRIVDMGYVIKQVLSAGTHSNTCTGGKLEVSKEIRNGLATTVVLCCEFCNKEFRVQSDSPEKYGKANEGLVWGTVSTGSGYSQTEELFAAIDVPIMCNTNYKTLEDKIGQVSGKKKEIIILLLMPPAEYVIHLQ